MEKQFYLTEEWKSIEPLSRAQLLLVIEGLKRGTIINGNWTSIIETLAKTGLEYRLNTSDLRLDPVIRVAKPEVFEEESKRKLSIRNPNPRGAYHRLNGWFLSYPDCCIEEYISPTLIIPQSGKFKPHKTYRFGRELEDEIKKTGKYPDFFDYCPPSFTPCSINCENARSILLQWKKTLDNLDSEAADELVYFNRRSTPERFAHKDYLKEKYADRINRIKSKYLREFPK